MATVRKQDGRKKRTPINDLPRSRLRVEGKDPNFEYYIVNDIPGNVEKYINAGWEPVSDENITIGDRRVSETSAVGSVNRVSVGQGLHAVLMKIPREYWEEDQKAKHDQTTDQILGIQEGRNAEGLINYTKVD